MYNFSFFGQFFFCKQLTSLLTCLPFSYAFPSHMTSLLTCLPFSHDTPSHILPLLTCHVWCQKMTNDTSLESSCALLLESAKKFANLQKLNFLSQNPWHVRRGGMWEGAHMTSLLKCLPFSHDTPSHILPLLTCLPFANLFADSKSRAQELSNDVSFVIFWNQT